MRTSLAMLIAFFGATAALAQGPAPTLKSISAVNKAKGLINLRDTVHRAVPVMKFIQKIQNGQVVVVAETVYEYQTVEVTIAINIANARVITPDGKQLPIEDVWKRAMPNVVVAVAGSSSTPAQAYLRALNADTLIIISPMRPADLPLPVPIPIPVPPEAKK